MTSVHLPIGDLAKGQLLAERFEIVRELGRGGYSVVYLAHDHRIGTDVAVKVLVPSPVAARQARERMRREVQAIRGLSHPNLIAVHDFLEDGSLAFVVMDYLEGHDLATMIETRGPLPHPAVAAMAEQLANALSAAHRAGTLHRDIKPANVLIDRSGRPFLTDFGSARLDSQGTLTATGGLVGTVAYLAPEVWLGQRADARADIYALGLTLYQALTGKLPERPSGHLPPTPSEDGFHPSAHRAGLPPWLDQLVATATTADPRYRFVAAEQMELAAKRQRFVPAIGPVEPVAVESPPPARLPLSFWILIGGVVISGMMAAIAASEHFFWATPIVALLLIRAGLQDRRLDRSSQSITRLPANALGGRLRERMASVPPGPTRVILDDILILAQGLVDGAKTPNLASRWRDQLEPLIDSAIATGVDLAQVDDTLGRLERDTPERRDPPPDWWDTLAALERTRDGLSTALLDVVGTLGRARTLAVDDFTGVSTRLDQELAELKGEVARRIAATRQLETGFDPS